MGLNPNTAAVGLPGPETFLSRPQYWVKAKKKKRAPRWSAEKREATRPKLFSSVTYVVCSGCWKTEDRSGVSTGGERGAQLVCQG